MGKDPCAEITVGGGGVNADRYLPITGQTRTYGLIGNAISASKSFDLHNRAFSALKLNGVYIPIETSESGLKDVINGLKAMRGVGGFNVTTPLKNKSFPTSIQSVPLLELQVL